MTRLYFYVVIAFAISFVAVSWAARGFPMHWSGPLSSLQPTITSTFGDQSAQDYERKKREGGHTAQSDTNPSLDKIRLEALQAATGFEMSPCDSTMKKNLIEALTAYTRAWQTKLDCPVKMLCNDEKLKAAAEAFLLRSICVSGKPLRRRSRSPASQKRIFQPRFVSTCFSLQAPASGPAMSLLLFACPKCGQPRGVPDEQTVVGIMRGCGLADR
ncbi:hypothetical protein ACF1BQ_002310 [Bradyrhizobium sp. RDT10]